MGRLDGKVALITGGARGQGRAIADKFSREGAKIVCCDVDTQIETIAYEPATLDDLRATAEIVRRNGADVIAEVADVRSQEQLDRVVQLGLDAFGKIDIVIANAGVVEYGHFWEISEEAWRDVIDICLTGAWRTAKSVAPHMIERGSGCMVFTASTNAQEGGFDYMHYIAAKHGILGVMRSAALELGPYNVRVHAVLPGPIDTLMNDNPTSRARTAGRAGATREEYLKATRGWHVLRGRTALPAESIADAMIWLVSEEARHATGVELVIDAGHRLLPGVNLAPIEDDEQMRSPASISAAAS